MQYRLAILVLAVAGLCTAQTLQRRNDPPRSDQSSSQQQGESSSKNTKIDLSPPKGDDIQHSDDEDDNTGVMETKPWNPHKAAKDIEVGDFYAKRKNYGAAISRYREALQYKPKDAEATFKLAHVLEVTKENAEALQLYQQYLKILPNGEFAPEAQKAVERLKPTQSAAKP